jgi:hypothetical protein
MRLTLLVLATASAIALPVGATETTAQIRFDACDDGAFDTNETVVILERELRASLSRPVSLSVVPPSIAFDGVDLSVAIVCENANDVSVLVSRHAATLAGEAAARLSLAGILPAARARLVALSAAETARFLVTEAATFVLPAPVLLGPPPPLHSLRRSPNRARLLRGVAFGLGALTIASAIVGAVLTTSTSSRGHDRHGADLDEIGPGVAFGIGGLSLVGTSVDVGLWMRERSSSPIPTLSASGAPLLEIFF